MKISLSWIIKVFIIFSFVILIFQSPLSMSWLPGSFGSIASSYDEIVCAIFGITLVVHLIKVGIPKKFFKEFLLFIVFVGIGFVCTLINNIQPILAVIEDVVSCTKFLITLLGFQFISKRYNSLSILKTLEKIAQVLIVIFFVLMVFDIIFPNTLFESTSYRYGLHAVHLFYYHPAVLSQVTVLLIAIISFRPNSIKHSTILKIMALCVIGSTLRTKAFGFISLYLFLWGYEKFKLGKARIVLVFLAVMTIAFLSSGNLDKYYGDEDSARSILTEDSISIAKENFPLGLGYGTFASASAAKYYSPVYVELGYRNNYGMGYINTNYLTDSFWPVLLGEFGYAGTVIYGGIILLILKKAYDCLKINKNIGIALLSLMIYFLISSTAATAFFNPIAVPNAFILVIGFNLNSAYYSKLLPEKNGGIDNKYKKK